jgi:hypothetical protein
MRRKYNDDDVDYMDGRAPFIIMTAISHVSERLADTISAQPLPLLYRRL